MSFIRSRLLEKLSNNRCYAVIPARGGSKGIPGKNIKLLNGKPLIQYAIDSLREADCFDRIIVTSDSTEILSVAAELGASIHLRVEPEESNDFTSSDVPTISCLKSLSSFMPEFAFMVQCTSPFVKPSSYRKAFHSLIENSNATVFAAIEAHICLWQESNLAESKGEWLPINHPFHERISRQFAQDKQVHEVGAFYGFRTQSFIDARYRFFSHALPVLLNAEEVDDIDTHEEWALAEYKIVRALDIRN